MAQAQGDRCPQEIVKVGDEDALKVALCAGIWNKKEKMAALFASAKYGKMDMFQMLIDKGVTPNGCNTEGRNVLHFAFLKSPNGSTLSQILSTVKSRCTAQQFQSFLDKVSCERNILPWRKGQAPLHLAVQRESAECVRILLEAGASVDVAMRGETITPLMKAAEKGSKEMVQMFVDAGANVNKTDSQGWTPLMFAVDAQADIEIPRILLQNGADVNIASKDVHETALMIALDAGNKDLVDLLLDHGADVERCTNHNESTLLRAVASTNFEVVEAVLKRHKILTQLAEEDSALVEAYRNGSLTIAKLLISQGWNLKTRDRFGQSCILAAATSGCVEALNHIIEEYLQRGMEKEVAEEATEALHMACNVGSVKAVEVLLKHKANPGAPVVKANAIHGRVSVASALFVNVRHLCLPFKILEDVQVQLDILERILLIGCDLDATGCLINSYSISSQTAQEHTVFEAAIISRAVEIAQILWLAGSKPCPVSWGHGNLPRVDKLFDISLDDFHEFRIHYEAKSIQAAQFIDDQVLQPRSLMDICRIKLRRLMQGDVENRVKTLPLPDHIKTYLNLCEMKELMVSFQQNINDPYKMDSASSFSSSMLSDSLTDTSSDSDINGLEEDHDSN